MEIDERLNRVRLLEPQPGAPARAMPGLGPLLSRRGWPVRKLVLFGVIGLIGLLMLVFSDVGLGFGVMLTFGSALALYAAIRPVVRVAGLMELADTVFVPLAPGPDGLLVAGAKVSLRLPGDGPARWLVIRMTPQYRLLLAGHRRGRLLGPDARGRAFLQLPGNFRVHAGRVRPEPPSGSQPPAPVVREPLPPGQDPVLAAHRRWSAGLLLRIGLLYLAVAATAIWAETEVERWSDENPFALSTTFMAPAAVTVAVMSGVIGILVLVAALKSFRPLPPTASWLELRVVLYQPRYAAAPTSVLTGQATLPDGSTCSFKTARLDASFAANITATGQLWVIGPMRLGKPVRLGLPGYPVIGSAKFSLP